MLGGAGRALERPHPLMGEPAPAFEAEQLDGEAFQLADELGEKVVMLDFWATWCGPCVRLAQVTAAAKELADQGVVFFAVNIEEDADKVREFLSEHELDAPVLLDADGTVGELYQADAIPQTVLIGKDGRVQVVHVGAGGNLKRKLVEQLTALVAGKDLAREELEKFAAAEKAATAKLKPFGLDEAWTAEGNYSSVAIDPATQDVWALRRGGVDRLDRQGELLGKVDREADQDTLRLAQLDGDEAAEFIVFQGWGNAVAALDDDGAALWTHDGGQGVDDVWCADLDGDGRDEVIVGYNGATGLHVVDADGEQRAENTALGNVWHVCAGRFSADAMQIVTTSATGNVHVFDADAKAVKDFNVGIYAHGIRMTPPTEAAAAPW